MHRAVVFIDKCDRYVPKDSLISQLGQKVLNELIMATGRTAVLFERVAHNYALDVFVFDDIAQALTQAGEVVRLSLAQLSRCWHHQCFMAPGKNKLFAAKANPCELTSHIDTHYAR